jgi:hypothetical protein
MAVTEKVRERNGSRSSNLCLERVEKMKDVGQAGYEIRVEGELDEDWAEWLEGMRPTVEYGGGKARITRLAGPVADQAALRGILSKLWDLNLTLISVNRMEKEV